MSDIKQQFPQVCLARHGETTWSITGQHNGSTDLPLTQAGERNARQLRQGLKSRTFTCVLTSPLQRAVKSCELAGFGKTAEVDRDLIEWNYGDYEGKTTAEIRQQRPGWNLFRDGCPQGESLADVAERADRLIRRIRALDGDVLLFSHGHLLHVLAARWLGLGAAAARVFYLDSAALSILGYHYDLDDPVVRLWNDCSHVVSKRPSS